MLFSLIGRSCTSSNSVREGEPEGGLQTSYVSADEEERKEGALKPGNSFPLHRAAISFYMAAAADDDDERGEWKSFHIGRRGNFMTGLSAAGAGESRNVIVHGEHAAFPASAPQSKLCLRCIRFIHESL